MNSESLSSIEITDCDIDEVEQLMGVKFDKQRRDIIKYMDDLEVQALPGTGKTTVLIAKLAILSYKWPYSNYGICVLSHTNVAREEIEKRIGRTEKSLLTYPHFIGTMNSFFDTFVVLPWLKSHGYKVRIIDTNTVVANRYRNLSQSTKEYLRFHHLTERACESQSFPGISFKYDLYCTKTDSSYRDVYNCVKQSMEDGYFTFDETLHIAEYVLEKYKFLPNAIQKRFPVILIDESQDTSNRQWKLIKKTFPEGPSVRQFFGDSNQAIYQFLGDENSQENMPKIKKQMTISNSYRFDESIAHLADPLGIIPGLTGSSDLYKKLDNKHMIFLFDNATRVLPAYAEYLLHCFTDEELNDNLDCYAVGMVHNKESIDYNKKEYPMGVKDYFLSYDSNITNSSFMPQYLIEYFKRGEYTINQSGDLYQLVDYIAKGLRTFIMSNTVLDVSNTGQAFNSLLKIIPEDKKDDFRFEFFKIVNLPIRTEKEWKRVVLLVKLLLNHYFNIGIDNNDEEFFRWENIGDADEENREMSEQNSQKQNIYTFQKGNRTVNIKLGSIHSVKGMTHLATLVLETYWYGKNIESLLPWLCGDINKNNSGKRILSRLRCHYVALTRASGLVCIAMSKHSVDEESRDRLIQNGWKITEL